MVNRQEKEWSKTEPVEVRGGYESATGMDASSNFRGVAKGGAGAAKVRAEPPAARQAVSGSDKEY